MFPRYLFFLFIALPGFLSACGTTYAVPEIPDAALAEAEREMARSRDGSGPVLGFSGNRVGIASSFSGGSSPYDDAGAARRLFSEVVGTVRPVAEEVCREEAASADIICVLRMDLVTNPTAPQNAYQTYIDGVPRIFVTESFIRANIQNPDELAFVLGHEAGHHISRHLEKRRQQAVASGAALGILTAVAQGLAAPPGGYNAYQQAQNNRAVSSMMQAGAALGQKAYSQTYELESDYVAAYVAERAGYDARNGSRVFARLGIQEGAEAPANAAAFWSTHPSSAERIALVISVDREIENLKRAGAPLRPQRKE